MTLHTNNPDITIRGGLINVPKPTNSIQGDRHKPNTPVNKKAVKAKDDFQPVADLNKPPVKTTKVKRKKKATDEIPEELE